MRIGWVKSAVAVTAPLGIAAAILTIYQSSLLVSPRDSHHLETPLALVAARQALGGFGSIYGPYTEDRPWVAIHAPLYYRIVGLCAWLPHRALGIDPVAAALYAGRIVSLLAWGATLLAVARLAQLGGKTGQVGIWAALMAASLTLGLDYPVTVRPDALGWAQQSWGLLLTLRYLLADSEQRRWRTLGMGYACFAFAICVKQHDAVLAAVSSFLLAAAWTQGWVRLKSIILAHALALAILIGDFAAERLINGELMTVSLFQTPGELRHLRPTNLGAVTALLVETAKRTMWLVAIAAACVAMRPRRTLSGDRADAILLPFLIAEATATLALYCSSDGAFTNYAVQAALIACALTARLLDRLLDENVGWRWLAPMAVALVWAADDFRLARHPWGSRIQDERDLTALVAQDSRSAARQTYFAAAHDANRRFGRWEWTHDEWLYDVFETVGAAPKRDDWMRARLTDGTIRRVIVTNDSERIPGVRQSLPDLGFRRTRVSGRYQVWEREP